MAFTRLEPTGVNTNASFSFSNVNVAHTIRANNFFYSNGAPIGSGSGGSGGVAITVSANDQPNITSVGTLTSLTVEGPIDLGSIGNITIPGGGQDYVLATDGLGHLNWLQISTGNPAGQAGALQFNDNGVFNGSGNLTFNKTTNTLNITNIATDGIKLNTLGNGQIAISLNNDIVGGPDLIWEFDNAALFTTALKSNGYITIDGNITSGNANLGNTVTANYFKGSGNNLSNIQGSNVTGAVSYATTANSVAGANVSGAVSYATTANSVAGANVSGTVASATVAASANSVAGANVSGAVTFASTANSVAGANVSGTVASATVAASANSVAGANVTGTVASATVAASANSVAAANVSGLGNLALINKDGNASNILYGNGVFASAPVTYGNSNVATYLASYGSNTISTTGNVSVGNIIGNGQALTGLNAANLTGTISSTVLGNSPHYIGTTSISLTRPSGSQTLTGVSIDGSAASATTAGTVTTNAQPNITSVGTLTSLSVSGDATVSGNLTVNGSTVYTNITNMAVKDPLIELGGGANGAALASNDGKDRGELLHYYTTAPVDAFMGWDNSNAEFAFGSNVSVTNEVITFNTLGNVRAGYFIGNGSQITGVAAANITGLGNIATINKDGSTSNVLYGNGIFAAPVVAVANVTGIGNIATINKDGNTSNVLYGNGVFAAPVVAVANVTGIGNLATINKDGNASNILYGNGVFAAAPSGGSLYGNANVATFLASFGSNTITTTGAINAGNVVSTGYGVFNGAYTEATTNPGVFIGNTGSGTPSPRIGFYNGNTSQNWQIDNYGGNFRWFTPGVVRMQLDSTGNLNLPNGYLTVPNGNVTANYFIGNGSQLTGITVTSTGTVTTNAQPNITSVGTLTSLTVTGTVTSSNNLIGSDQLVLNSKAGATEGAQLVLGWKAVTGLTGQGNSTWNMDIDGSNNLRIFSQDASGTSRVNLTASPTNTDITVGGNVIATNANLGNLVTANYHSGSGNMLSNIQGANVSGAVAYATTANSVAVANVSGIGNIATINKDGNASNILYGNGVFASAPVTYGNSNVATFLSSFGSNTITTTGNVSVGNIIGNGQALTGINGSNVTGAVSYATTANAVAGANVSGAVSYATTANSVAGANVSGAVAYATTANAVAGANVTGQVSNSLIAGTVYTAAQPNITSVGTLTSLSVTGNTTSGNIISNGSVSGVDLSISGNATISGNLIVSGTTAYTNVTTLAIKDPLIEIGGGANGATLTSNDSKDRGSLLHYYTTAPVDAFMGWDNSNAEFAFGSNVSVTNEVVTFNSLGNVRAGYFIGNGSQLTGLVATVASTVTSNAQPNITSVGTLTSLAVTGNITSGNANLGNLVTANFFSGAGNNLSNIQGSNVSGQVSNSLVAGTVYTAAQPNITSVGTLTSLAVTGNITSGNANLGNLVTANFFSGAGNLLSNIQGGNVTGAVSYATTANSVAAANVSGLGNLALLNKDGNASNILYGNGVFASAPVTYGNSNVATYLASFGSNTITTTGNVSVGNIIGNGQALTGINGSNVTGQVANSLVAGTVYTNAQPNITSVGTLTSLTVTGNVTAGNISYSGSMSMGTGNGGTLSGANLISANYFSGSGNLLSNIQVANVTGLGNLALVNKDGNASNVLYGNGVFAAPSGGTYSNSNVSSFLANLGSNIISSTANIVTTGKILGGITTTSLTNPVAVFSGGGATYSQLAVINPTGTGSADITTYGNNGDDTQSWADMGFTGNTFNDANYTVTAAGDGYFFTQGNASFGGNMVIATGATGTTKDIVFATGGFLTANIKARLYNANGVFSVTNGISTGNLTANAVTLKKYNETVLASANTAASISPDVSTGTIFRYTANAAFTFSGLTNAVAGTSATVIITQDATGSRVMTSTMKFSGGLKTLSTAANSIDVISVFYDGTTYYASLSKGFA